MSTLPHVLGKWSMVVGNHIVGIEKTSDGTWLAFRGLMPQYDPHGTSGGSERVDTFEAALRFVGWPVGLVDMPPDLAKLA